MRREVRSFWYPTWLAQPAALVPDSKLVDAPPHRLSFADIAPYARQYELLVIHTSSPSFVSDVKTAEAMRELNPDLKIGFIGAKVAVEPEGEPRSVDGDQFRCPQRVRLHHQGSR